jgi:3-phenylpropionate/cinnamic acid dioxygenase small subunit
MAANEPLYQQLAAVLYKEADYLDRQDWQGWLDQYCDDAIFWAPAWQDESKLTTNPKEEVSLFYIEGKAMLEDRVWRWSGNESPASLPLPRTSHLIGNVSYDVVEPEQVVLRSRWHTQVFRRKRTWSYAGAYRHRLRRENGMWKIAEKYVVIVNDLIDTTLDLYHV